MQIDGVCEASSLFDLSCFVNLQYDHSTKDGYQRYLTFWICSKSLPSRVTYSVGDCESAGLLPNRTTQHLMAFKWSFCFLNQLDTSTRSLLSRCSISGMNLEAVYMEVTSANWLVSQNIAGKCPIGDRQLLLTATAVQPVIPGSTNRETISTRKFFTRIIFNVRSTVYIFQIG